MSIDFFTVPTIRFQVLYVFLVLAHDRRRILHFNITAHPTVVLANSDLADTVGVAHFPSIPADRRVIGIARLHAVCFSNAGGVAA